jgi:hypothetical protein
MKFRLFLLLIFLIFAACQHNSIVGTIGKKSEKKYKNSGFALIYNNDLTLQKLDDRSLQIFHKTLKKKTLVKITNPNNKKYLIAEVKSDKEIYSNFFNSVISNRIAETLELDVKEPFIEITLISRDSTFVAKKAKTFDEEKNVAEKAPIDTIKVSNLSNVEINKTKKKHDKKFSYSIKVADFYYEETAQSVLNRIKKETSLKNINLIKLSKTNYRVLIGPFNDIKSLRESFEKMNTLYFENLEVLKNV